MRDVSCSFDVVAVQVQVGTDNLSSARTDDGVHLSMDTAAHVVGVWAGVVGHPVPVADSNVHAVSLAPGVAVVAGRYDLVVVDNHAAVVATKACRPSRDSFCYTYVVVMLVGAY